MLKRSGIFTIAAAVALSAAPPLASAGNWGFSFGHRSSSPRCYSTHRTSYRTHRYYSPYVSYYRPSSYRSVVVRDGCATVPYRTTYTRSAYYTSPRYYNSRTYRYSPSRHHAYKRSVRTYAAPRAYRVDRHYTPRVYVDRGRHQHHYRHYRPHGRSVHVRVHRH